jgi:AraC-like DNA-binding protein
VRILDELREAVKRYGHCTGREPFRYGGQWAYDPSFRSRAAAPAPDSQTGYLRRCPGAKREIFGDRRLEYGAGQALIVCVETPAVATIVEASPGEPFLGIVIEFDLAILRDVLNELATPPGAGNHIRHGVLVTDFSGPLADCVFRMVRLLNSPQAIPILYPGIMREICYWILTGPHAEQVVRMTMANTHEQNVIRAIHFLRHRFGKAIRIKELAAVAKMSETAFHRHFKTMTSMTPLQYQKQLRLIEARRLMLAESMNVETAAFQVGYESPSQFSRKYTRMFGASPRRDIAALQLVAS